MTTLYCALCGDRIEADDAHVEIEAEHVRMGDVNDIGEFVCHPGCWQRLSEGWEEPV